MPRGIRSASAQILQYDIVRGNEKPGAPWKSEKPEEWEDKVYRGDGTIMAHTEGKPELPDYFAGEVPRGDEDFLDGVDGNPTRKELHDSRLAELAAVS